MGRHCEWLASLGILLRVFRSHFTVQVMSTSRSGKSCLLSPVWAPSSKVNRRSAHCTGSSQTGDRCTTNPMSQECFVIDHQAHKIDLDENVDSASQASSFVQTDGKRQSA